MLFQMENNLLQECEVLREIVLNAPPDEPWAAKTSCVLETLPAPHLAANPQLRTSYDLFKDHRSTWPLSQAVWDILFASQLTEMVHMGLLGPNSCLFNEQYIVKPPRSGLESSFAWHRDSDWCRDQALGSFISIWVALDDVHADNGGLLVRPGTHLRTMTVTDDGPLARKPIPIHLSAGSAVILSDMVAHSSGPNPLQYARRAWMPQFSSSPVVWRSTKDPVSLAIPLQVP